MSSSLHQYQTNSKEVGTLPTDLIFLFLFLNVAIGAVISYALPYFTRILRYQIPYTVLMFFVGLLFSYSLTTKPITPAGLVLHASISKWNMIHSNTILVTFLPVLMFSEAMMTNVYRFAEVIGPSIWLAIPGCVFMTFALGAVVKVMMPYSYDWPWSLCLITGCILSATDPVSVISNLKSSAAPEGLTYTIIGEALLNDGTALVLFTFFTQPFIVDGGSPLTVSGAVIYFSYVTFVSPLVGFIFGLVFSIPMRHASQGGGNSSIIQISLTLSCAYLSYFVADFELGLSGIISCAAAGCTISWLVSPVVLKSSEMRNFWDLLDWLANTLLFTLTGIIFGYRAINYETPRRFVDMLSVYFAMLVLRAIMLGISMPVLSNFGRQCTLKEIFFISWGGLRGGISIALALTLDQAASEGSISIRSLDAQRIFFISCGACALTLLINATTVNKLLSVLNIADSKVVVESDISAVSDNTKNTLRRKMLTHMKRLLLAMPYANVMMIKQYAIMMRTPLEIEADEARIRLRSLFAGGGGGGGGGEHESSDSGSYCTEDELRWGEMDRAGSKGGKSLSVKVPEFTSEEQIRDFFTPGAELSEQIMLTRKSYTNALRGEYFKLLNCEWLPRNSIAASTLISSVELNIDKPLSTPLNDWNIVEQALSLHPATASPFFGQCYDAYVFFILVLWHIAGQILRLFPTLAANRQKASQFVSEDVAPHTTEEQLELQERSIGGIVASSHNSGYTSVPPPPSSDNGHESTTSNQSTINEHVRLDATHRPRLSGCFALFAACSRAIQKWKATWRDIESIYTLCCYIEAHSASQIRVLGNNDRNITSNYEESIVLLESQNQVKLAKEKLGQFDQRLLTLVTSKQAARVLMIIAINESISLGNEGVLSPRNMMALKNLINSGLGKLDAVSEISLSALYVLSCNELSAHRE